VSFLAENGALGNKKEAKKNPIVCPFGLYSTYLIFDGCMKLIWNIGYIFIFNI
jgi:hypothetical protein